MPFLLRNCNCAAVKPPKVAVCNKAVKEGDGVGDDRIKMLVEHMYQGNLGRDDVQTSARGFAAEEMSRWTFREVSLWISEWSSHYSNPDLQEEEQIVLDFLDMLDCSTRNKGYIAEPAFRRHDKAKHVIPVLRGLLPELASQETVEGAINTLSEDPNSLEEEYRYLAAAESQPITKEAGDLEGMKNEIRRWVTARDMAKAKAKVISKMRGQLLLFGLFDYASQLREERLNADDEAGGNYSSDEDDGLDDMLMDLDQPEEQQDTGQQDTKAETEPISVWWSCCPGADRDDLMNEMLELEPGSKSRIAPSMVASIQSLKRTEYEEQGEWKEHLTHDGKKYYYLVSKETNADGVVEEIPTG